jgi:hypothetical protein
MKKTSGREGKTIVIAKYITQNKKYVRVKPNFL